MKPKTDYTSNARKFAFNHPIITSVSTQINFWVVAYMVLAGIIYNYSLFINSNAEVEIPSAPVPAFLGSFIMACFFGTALGLSDHFIFKKWSSKRSLGLLILVKGLFYLVIMTIMFAFMRYVFYEFFVLRYYFKNAPHFFLDQEWPYMYKVFTIYTFAMGLVIGFILQINKKFGPGVLIPLLLGKYINPIKEERIFMFLDLESSTRLAEKLGHIKYSELIRDCFLVINKVTIPFQAEIYQYVGDEVVLTWLVRDGFDRNNCINFFYACEKSLKEKEDYFIDKYGSFPCFKAGMHEGWVTGVEVGNIKREVAYHGDTLNVSSRIQKKCKVYNCDLLISDTLKEKIAWKEDTKLTEYEAVHLAGSNKEISLFQVNRIKA